MTIGLMPEVIVEDVVGVAILWCRTIEEKVVITGLRPIAAFFLTGIVDIVGIFFLCNALGLFQ